MMERIEDLPELRKKRKVAAVLWYAQGDAAAKVGAEVDGGGGEKISAAGASTVATRSRQ